MTLVEFVRARFAEAEQWTRAADAWFEEHGWIELPDDPARVLPRVAADRLILADHTTPHTVADDGFCVEEGGECTHAGEGWCNWHGEDDCPTVRALALRYDDHPDYLDEWSV